MSTFQNTKEVEASAKTRMEKVLADFQHDMTTIRTGRASVNMLEPVQIEAYGSMMPINHVATLHVPEPALITVQPFDVSQIGAIDKAIRNAGLGLNPSNDGKIIRIPIPPLNEERRKELVKRVYAEGETAKVAIRSIRRDNIEQIKKLQKDGLSEDIAKDGETRIQGITDKNILLVDQHCKDKEKEIMTI